MTLVEGRHDLLKVTTERSNQVQNSQISFEVSFFNFRRNYSKPRFSLVKFILLSRVATHSVYCIRRKLISQEN